MGELEQLTVSPQEAYDLGLRDGEKENQKLVDSLTKIVAEQKKEIERLEEIIDSRLLKMHRSAIIRELERIHKWIKSESVKSRESLKKYIRQGDTQGATLFDHYCLSYGHISTYLRRRIRALKVGEEHLWG